MDQPSEDLSKLEKHSTIYIAFHESPLIMSSNTFDSNVGLFGGAVTIESPNFYSGDYGVDPAYDQVYKPYTLIHDNNFYRNQAYMSGNAFYIRSTKEIESEK